MNPIEQAKQHLEQAFDLYENHEDFQQALEVCEVALHLDPHLAEAHNLRGILLEEMDKPLRAVGAYRKALKLDPDFIEAKENLEALKAEFSGANPLVTIAVVDTLGQAYPLKARLEDEGIKVIIPNEEYIIFGRTEPEDTLDIHLLIRKSDASAAIKILENESELIDGEPEFVDDAGEPIVAERELLFEEPQLIDVDMEAEVTCAWCGSYKVGQTFPLPFVPRKWKCQDCGRVWAKS